MPLFLHQYLPNGTVYGQRQDLSIYNFNGNIANKY